jgi:hypothetical protein
VADTEHGSDDIAVQPHPETAVEHADETAHEPQDRPEDWGWHGETGKWARGAGWVSVAVLLLMNLGNQTRHNENIWLTAVAALLVVILLRDRHRRKNAWRDK